jgi:uncharacterized protein
MLAEHVEIFFFFFAIAAVYAAAGFGGGSSYLALLALYALPMTTMKPTALLCNIVVVTGGTYIFWKNGYLNWRKILPLSIASIPMAFLGGLIPLKEKTFFILLGISLVLAAMLLIFQKIQSDTPPQYSDEKTTLKSSIWGASIGFLSGLVGIGGGIFLSPVLNLWRWDTPKHIAATASFFILVNSISGLAGQLAKNPHLDGAFTLPLMAAVLLGGQLGSRLSALKFNQTYVRWTTAALVLYAGANILYNNL